MSDETVTADLREGVSSLIEQGEWGKLVALVAALHPADLTEVVLDLSTEPRVELVTRLPADMTAQLFSYANDEQRRLLIETVGIDALPGILDEAPDDVAADVVQQLDALQQVEILAALDQGAEIAELLGYGTESAGGRMSRGYVSLPDETTVDRAIAYLRMLRPPSDQAYYLYVVDRDRRLQGVVSVRDLIVAAPRTKLREITIRDVHAVTTDTDQEEVALTLQRYNLLAVPVVDDDGRLVGVTTHDDLVDVLSQEATEDMYRMVGLDETERVFSPVRTSVRRRLPWMAVNLVTAFMAAGVVSMFDATLARATVLAAFMPVVAGQGGNAGAQTATIAVRSIAIGELGVPDIVRACRKEIVVGLANGLALGLLAAIAVYAWEMNLTLALVLGAALVLNITTATLAGIVIPLGLKAAGVDPALAATIFVTTITDVLGFLFFLGLASIVISQIA